MNRYTSILNGGSLAGALFFALFLILYYVIGVNPLGGFKFLGLIIPIVLMYYAVKRFKETEGEGFLTYGRGFLMGIFFTFIYSSLSAMLIYLYGLTIDGSFVDFFKEENLNAMGEAKDQLISLLGEESYREMIEEIQNVTLASLALSDFQSKTIGGFIIALIIAAVLKQNPPTFVESED